MIDKGRHISYEEGVTDGDLVADSSYLVNLDDVDYKPGAVGLGVDDCSDVSEHDDLEEVE